MNSARMDKKGRWSVHAARESFAHLATSHPALFVLIVALVIRVAAIVLGRLVLSDQFLAIDDDTYFLMATQIADGSSVDWNADVRALSRSAATFVMPLTAIVYVFGEARWPADMFVGFVGAATAATTTLLGVRLASRRVGITAGLAVALLPSQVAWSSTTLKDPLVWLLEVVVVVAVVVAITEERRWALPLAVAAGAMFALCFTRLHSAVVLGWALVVAGAWLSRRWGWQPVLLALVLSIVVPSLAGAGYGGWRLVFDAPAPSTQRLLAAEGAESAIGEAADTEGVAPSGEGARSWITELAHLPRGYAVTFLEPYPWERRTDARFLLAKFDTLLFYPLLALACVGAWASITRVSLASIVVAVVAALATVFALFEGNLGTAFRHRGELVWGVALLAAIGVERIRSRHAEEFG